MMLERLARSVIAAPRLVLRMALLIAIAAAIFGVPVTKHLPPVVSKTRTPNLPM